MTRSGITTMTAATEDHNASLATLTAPSAPYTVVAISRDLNVKRFPLFPYTVSGYSRDGIEITAIIQESSPEAASAVLEECFDLARVSTIYEGIVGIKDGWKWMGYLPAPERKPRGLMSLLRYLW